MTAMTPSASDSSQPASDRAARAGRWLVGAAAVLACLAVFGLYTVPDFMVMLADQLWACF